MAVKIPASVKGVIGGVVALSVLDLVISTDRGNAAFSWAATAPASWLASWLDPTKPLITDQRTTTTSSGGSGGSSGGKSKPNCSGLVGTGLWLCQQGLAAYNTPNTNSLPTPSTAQSLSV